MALSVPEPVSHKRSFVRDQAGAATVLRRNVISRYRPGHMMVDVYLVFGWQKSRMQMESATHIEREFVAS